MSRKQNTPEAWTQTWTGKKFSVENLSPEMICIEDIAHSLSMQCRYNGHLSQFYSVAQHSVECVDLARARHEPTHYECLQVLLHDAAEAYIGDLPLPIKRLLPEFAALENRIWREAIAPKFGLPDSLDDLAPVVGIVDWHSVSAEKEALIDPHTDEAGSWCLDPTLPAGFYELTHGRDMLPWPQDFAEAMFLAYFYTLT